MAHMTNTMKRMALGMASVALVAMGTACAPMLDGKDGDGAVSAATYVTRSTTLRTQLMCRAAFECPQLSSSLVAVLGRYADEDTCARGAVKLVRDTSLDDEMVGIGATVDPDQAVRCLDALEAQLGRAACDIDPNPVVCDGVLAGPGERGDACGGDYHCGAGLYCDIWNDSSCGGTCIGDGDDDDWENTCGDEVCGDDEQCDYYSDSCVPKGAAGDSCEPYGLSDCSRESDDVVCMPDDESYDTGTCVAMGTLQSGEYCDYVDDACAPGLTCDSTTVTCEPTEPEPPIQLGAAGQVCHLSYAPCGPGLVCAGPGVPQGGGQGVCVPVKGVGQACAHVLECSPELACLTDTGDATRGMGTCAPPAADGARCDFGLDCASGHCEDGLCSRRELTTCTQ